MLGSDDKSCFWIIYLLCYTFIIISESTLPIKEGLLWNNVHVTMVAVLDNPYSLLLLIAVSLGDPNHLDLRKYDVWCLHKRIAQL